MEPPDGLNELARQVGELRERVLNLEQHLQLNAPAPTPHPLPAASIETTPTLEATATALPILGRALLGLAGAYLLRALTEAGAIPATVGVIAGIAYALLWLVLAARAPAGENLVVAVHALTAALVLAPLLFEATVRLHLVEPAAAAVLLAFFSTFGLAISWRDNLAAVAWITTLGGVGAAVVLLFATQHVVPFTFALLAIAAAIEVSAFGDHWLGERWIVAAVADLVLLHLTLLVTSVEKLPEEYAPIPTMSALAALGGLLLVYLGSTLARTLIRGLPITVFETAQTVLAFLIALWGALRIAAGAPGAAIAVGAFALVGAAGCYLVSYALVERRAMPRSNLYTYTSFAVLLVLAGSRLLVSGLVLSLSWSALALLCLWGGLRSNRRTLQLQAAVYLVMASLISGALGGSSLYLLSEPNQPGFPPLEALLSAVAAAAALVLFLRDSTSEPTRIRRAVMVIVAGLAVWMGAGMLARVLFVLTAGAVKTPAFSATLATILLSACSGTLVFAGRRLSRPELVWLVPPLLALTGYKLLTQDLRYGQTWTLFLSLVAYGAVLVLMPRLLHRRGTNS